MENARPTELKVSAVIGRDKVAATQPLVFLACDDVFTTSNLIAEKFGKQHKNVLRAIENLECSPAFAELNFELSEYTDSTGRSRPMYRLSRDGFSFLAMGFTGRAAAYWKEQFIGAFNAMECELRQIATTRAVPEWVEARQLGKLDRRDLTDAVRGLCEQAHQRGDSTTPLARWIMSATKVVTSALFETNGEPISAIRDRLTARQLRRLAVAEEIYARAVEKCLGSDLHHRAIYEQAKCSVLAYACATGGREVPGLDRRAVGALAGGAA